MRGRVMGLALVVAVGSMPAFADNARPRGGGSSGGGGSSAGARHHSGGGGSSRSGGGSSYSRPSGGGARPPSGAEARHPRAGTGTGSRYYGGYGYPYYGYGGYPYYGYRPYYYGYGYWPYWGSGYGYGYYPYYGYGYGGYGGYGYAYGGGGSYGNSDHDESGAVRTFVEPLNAKVYVDGRQAGIADDFDGLTQRLYVSPGAHEILLSLEGYKTHRVKVYVAPGDTLKLHYDMVKGSGEDAKIDILGNPEDERFGKRERRYYDDEDDDDRDEVRQAEPRDGQAPPRRADDNDRPKAGLTWGNELGTVRLSIEPGDASVYVDGRFRGPASGIRSLRLTPGKHRIEVVRPGFRTEERDLDVGDGEDTTLELELTSS